MDPEDVEIGAESIRQLLCGKFRKCFSPWSRIPPEVWCEEVRRMLNGARFRWAYAPYLRKMFTSIFEPGVIETIYQLFSRGGKSEVILNALGYVIDQSPRRILVLYPTSGQCEKFSKDNFMGELVNPTPCLFNILGAKEGKRNANQTIMHKHYPGGLINMFGANSPGEMRRAKGQFLYADEIDAIDECLTDEGDQLAIFNKRGDEFFDTVRVFASYPSLAGKSRIHARMQDTDYQQWYVTCVKCGREPFVMNRKEHLKYDPYRPQDARLECPRCKALLTDDERYAMAHLQGFDNWKPTREFRGKRGFQGNALLWPHPVDKAKYPGGFLQMLAQQEIDAEKADNPARARRVMINTVDAEVYDPDTSTEIPPDWQAILNRREKYATEDGKIIIPKKGLYMTFGADVQRDRVEITKTVWGREEECWHVEHVVVVGDVKTDGIWDDVEKELLREYDHESGAKLSVSFGLIDAGDGAENILKFLGRLHRKASQLHGKIRACRGSSLYPHPIVDFKFSRLAKQLKGHWVGGDEAKDLIYARLKMTQEGPGYRHYGLNFTEKNAKQLCAEKVTVGFERGQETRRFKNEDHARNEELDCAVYGFAAFRLKRPNFDILEREMMPAEEKKEEAPKVAPVKMAKFVGGGRWVV